MERGRNGFRNNMEDVVINNGEFKEKASRVIGEAFSGVQEELAKKVLTVMGLHAFPEKNLDEEGQEISLQEWIETEVHPLETPEDFEHFTKMLQMAYKSLSEEGRGRFLPTKQVERRSLKPNATRVVQTIKSGFKNMRDIERLFSYAQLDVHKNINDFLVDRRKGKVGHERYTACRLLKRAFAMSVLEKHMQDVGQWARYLFGEEEEVGEADCPDSRNKTEGESELGLFYGVKTSPKFFKEEKERREEGDFYNWKLVDEFLESPTFHIGGLVQHGIKFMELSFKDANEALRKMERKGRITIEELNELFRFRVVLRKERGEPDDAFRLRKLMFLKKIDQLAQNRKTLPVEVEIRTINGLPTFSDNPDVNLKHQEAMLSPYEFSNFKLKREARSSNGDTYSNFSAKIKYIDPETGKLLFAFEIQVVGVEEFQNNENPKTRAAHFPMKIEAVGGLELPRTDSVMTEKQYLAHIESWLRNYHERHPEKRSLVWETIGETEKWAKGLKKGGFPKKLEGVHTHHDGWQSNSNFGEWRADKEQLTNNKRFTMDFAPGGKKINDKIFKKLAKAAFEFLFASGQIRKVPLSFPDKLEGTKIELETSNLFFGTDAYRRIVEEIPKVSLEDECDSNYRGVILGTK